jgi:hypothetical protein
MGHAISVRHFPSKSTINKQTKQQVYQSQQEPQCGARCNTDRGAKPDANQHTEHSSHNASVFLARISKSKILKINMFSK